MKTCFVCRLFFEFFLVLLQDLERNISKHLRKKTPRLRRHFWQGIKVFSIQRAMRKHWWVRKDEWISSHFTYLCLENKKVRKVSIWQANFAKWEPGHGRFRYRHPWKHYLIVGSLTRECAYRIDALNGHLFSHLQVLYSLYYMQQFQNTHTHLGQELLHDAPTTILHMQYFNQFVWPITYCDFNKNCVNQAFYVLIMQMHVEVGGKLEDICTKISLESSKAMQELASAIKTMTIPSSSSPHITNLKEAAENLQCLLKSELWKDVEFLQVIPVITVTSVLIEIVVCVEKIANSVHELARIAKFKNKKEHPELNYVSKEKSKAESSKVGILPDHEVVVTVKDWHSESLSTANNH